MTNFAECCRKLQLHKVAFVTKNVTLREKYSAQFQKVRVVFIKINWVTSKLNIDKRGLNN